MTKRKSFLMILAMVLILPFAFMLTGCFGDENDDDNSEEKSSYRIVVEQPRGGNITVSKNSAQEGEEITLSHQADRGYYFVSYVVIGENERTISVNNNKFTMPASNVFVSARFAEGENPNPGQDDTEVETYTISVSQTTGGSIRAYKSRAVEGEVVNLSFSENNGYSFNGFVVKDQNNNTIVVTNNSFTMPASNVTVSGTFTRISQNEYAIEIMDNHYGNITYSSNSHGREGVMGGARVTLSCDIYSENMKFVRWQVKDSNNNDISVVDNSFIMPESNVTVNAVLEEKNYNLVVDENVLDKCTIRVEDYYGNDLTTVHYNDEVYLTCEVNSGYSFERWNVSDGSSTLSTSTNKITHFYVRGNETIIISAIINPKSYSIQTNGSNTTDFYLIDSEGRRTSVASTGDELSVVCVPSEGYEIKTLRYYMKKRQNSVYGGTIAHDDIDLATKKFVVPAVDGADYIEISAEIGIIEKTLTITYLDQDKQTVITDLTPATFKNTDEIVELPTPEKAGYRFDEWYQKIIYDDGESYEEFYEPIEYIFPDVNSKDLTLIAKWVKVGTITYHLGIMEDVEGYVITNNNPATYENTDSFTFANASQRGATFNGWYTTEDFKEESKITSVLATETDAVDLELYAKWTYIAFTIDGNYRYYYWNYLYIYQELELGTADKPGYDFVAWYTTRDCQAGTEISKIEKGQLARLAGEDSNIIEIYSKFTLHEYTIAYHRNGGTIADNANPTTYTTEDEDITLVDPTRDSYTFNGWFTEETFDNKVEKIEKGTYGDLNLYALWNKNSEDFMYNKGTITGLSEQGKTKSNLTIPTEIEGYTITKIADKAFKLVTTMKSLVIPNTVTTLGQYCFDQCDVETIEFTGNSTITTIPWGAFRVCRHLTSLNLPDTVETIEGYAFESCKYNFESLPSSLKTIGKFAFTMNGTTDFVLPKSVTSIGVNAFESMVASTFTFESGINIQSLPKRTFSIMRNLTTITIPACVTSIGEEIFYYCENLETVNFAEGSNLTSIGVNAFAGTTSMSTISLPSSLTVIGPRAFYSSGIVSIEIPKNITKICEYAFADEWNGALTTITFEYGSKLREIERDAFSYCKSLTSIIFPSNLEIIGSGAFSFCTSLSQIGIPVSVKYIGSGCFYNIDFDNLHDSYLNKDTLLAYRWHYGEYNYQTSDYDWTMCDSSYQTMRMENVTLKGFLINYNNLYTLKCFIPES